MLICQSCGKQFSYNEDFYKMKGYAIPKRCPECLGNKFRRVCLLEESCVKLHIPQDCIYQSVYLTRGKKSVSCLRLKIGLGDQSITIYDHRNTNPEFMNPIVGDLAFASLRIMKDEDAGYRYVVLDKPHGKENCNLVLSVGQLREGGCKWCLVGSQRVISIFSWKGR